MSRFGLLNKDKAEKFFVFVRNDEASATISRGEPCCLIMDGTRDGFDVVSANSGAAAKATTLFAGIVAENMLAGKVGQAQVFGFVTAIKVVRQTRAASTDSWASFPAVAVGDVLNVETVANGASRSAAGGAGAMGNIIAGETLASATTLASGASGAGLALTANIKGFVRAM